MDFAHVLLRQKEQIPIPALWRLEGSKSAHDDIEGLNAHRELRFFPQVIGSLTPIITWRLWPPPSVGRP